MIVTFRLRDYATPQLEHASFLIREVLAYRKRLERIALRHRLAVGRINAYATFRRGRLEGWW